jgi:chaperonin cofactor prefoldin
MQELIERMPKLIEFVHETVGTVALSSVVDALKESADALEQASKRIAELESDKESARKGIEMLSSAIDSLMRENERQEKCIEELQAELDAARKQEPHHWIVPDFGFLFSSEEAAKRHLRNVDSRAIEPIACYAAPVLRDPKYSDADMVKSHADGYAFGLRQHPSAVPALRDLSVLSELADAAEVHMHGGVSGLRPAIDKARALLAAARQPAQQHAELKG